MAGETEPETDHLSFLETVAANVRRFGFFAAARGAEARGGGRPRIGRALHPADDIVRMAHAPTMDFPAATLESIETTPRGGRRMRGHFLGLTGPMGALPLHLTEYAAYERKSGGSRPFGDFLDLISNRILQFFYRAWADGQPAAQADRPADDRFAVYLDALSGAADGRGDWVAFRRDSRRHYAGAFAGSRNPASIQDALSHLLGTPVRVREFIGRWREIESADQTGLGREGFGLGQGAVLGRRVRVADDTVRFVVRLADRAAYETLLPSGDRFSLAAEGIEAFTPPHLSWELELEIPEARVTGARLGGTDRLGWSTWLAPRGTDSLRADARVKRPTGGAG